jgi:multidrug efflux pump subunit AcrB
MVDLDQQALQSRGLAPEDVSQVLQRQNVILPAGGVAWARAKASIVESELAIRLKFENGAVSTEKNFAPAAWLASLMSASVIASPWQ